MGRGTRDVDRMELDGVVWVGVGEITFNDGRWAGVEMGVGVVSWVICRVLPAHPRMGAAHILSETIFFREHNVTCKLDQPAALDSILEDPCVTTTNLRSRRSYLICPPHLSFNTGQST